MIDMDNILKARELTASFNSNQWSRMTMQRRDPSIVSSHTPTFKQAIAAIELAYPNSTWEEACFLVKTNTDAPSTCEYCDGPVPFRPGNTKAPYKKFCCNECKVLAQANPAAEAVTINGVFYRDFTHAMEATGESRFNIREKIFDSSIPEYKWADNHDQKCIDKLTKQSPLLVDTDLLQQWANDKRSFTSIEEEYGLSRGNISTAYSFFQIKHTYDQVSTEARKFLDDKDRFALEFSLYSMERLSLIYSIAPGTVKNYAIKYGLDTTAWANGVSKSETEMYNFVKEYYPDTIQSYRKVFGPNGPELDVYIPSLNMGIEFNGVYTHSHKVKQPDYHRTKHLRYRDKGIRYIQIWEDDWTYRNEKVKNFLVNAIGKNTYRVGARLTNVIEISQSDFDTFINKHHMQGTTNCKYRYALVKDGTILSAIGIRDIPINNQDKYHKGYGVDLARFANTNVSGAFTKLVKHVERTLDCNYILSFADLEIVSPFANVYSANRFTLVKELSHDYRYYNSKTKTREHKFNWRKETFKKMGLSINGKTEFDLADEWGLLRCYDSGKLLYMKTVHDRIINRIVTLDM